MGNPTAKRCTKCGRVKRWDLFSPDRRNNDGLQSSCKDCLRRRRRQAYVAVERRQYMNEWRYGLTTDEFEKLASLYDGLCHICKQDPIECVDHDHATGLVRGLLCHGCNRGLGQFKDSLDRIKNGVTYLENSR